MKYRKKNEIKLNYLKKSNIQYHLTGFSPKRGGELHRWRTANFSLFSHAKLLQGSKEVFCFTLDWRRLKLLKEKADKQNGLDTHWT